MLGRNPELRLISASHTADLAVGLNRDVQRIMTSEAYAKLFETALQGSAAAPAGAQLLSTIDNDGEYLAVEITNPSTLTTTTRVKIIEP
jgi:hypothetical protein